MILFVGRVEGGGKKGVTVSREQSNWMELMTLVPGKRALETTLPSLETKRRGVLEQPFGEQGEAELAPLV